MRYYIHRYLIFLPALAYLVIAFCIKSDYAVTWDEPFQMLTGEKVYNYVFNGDDTYLEYINNDYGVFFQLPVTFIIKTLGLNEMYSITLVRRSCLILLFTVFLMCFGQAVYKLFKSQYVAILSCVIIIFTPRIFAHSIFNTKDIALLCTFFIAFYGFMQYLFQPTFKRLIIAAFLIAGAIDTRIIGVELFPIALSGIVFLRLKNFINNKQLLQHSLIFILTITVFIVIMRPILWHQPDEFFTIIGNMSKFRWTDMILYLGEEVPSTELPWHYLIVWFFIGNPIFVSVTFLTSLALVIKLFFSSKKKWEWLNTHHLIWLYAISIPVLTFSAIVIKDSVVYDGWRHIFFVYPFVVLSIAFLIYETKKWVPKKLQLVIITVCLTPTLIQGIKNHPAQQSYFNPILQSNAYMEFEMDYWGAANNELLVPLCDTVQQPIEVHSILGNFYANFDYVNQQTNKNNLKVATTFESCDYYLHTVRWKWEFNDSRYTPIDTTWAYGNPISILFKNNQNK